METKPKADIDPDRMKQWAGAIADENHPALSKDEKRKIAKTIFEAMKIEGGLE